MNAMRWEHRNQVLDFLDYKRHANHNIGAVSDLSVGEERLAIWTGTLKVS